MSKTIITDESLINYVNPDHVLHYINTIFKNAIDIDPAWMVEVRKVGQYRVDDGTSSPAEQSIAAQLLMFDPYNPIPGLAQWVVDKVLKAAPIGIGTFMAPALLNDRRANDSSVVRMLTVCADFDTGNPQWNLQQAVGRIGVKPTLVCTSGGVTADGHMKLHAHWRLDEPCDEPWKVAYIREQLAKQFGADQSFKRIPQIIRIPGALYDKQGKWGTTLITEYNDHDIGMMQFEEALSIDWDNLAEDSIFSAGRGKTKEERADRLHALQTEEVEAGRSADTRWDRFSEYAGHQIRQARFGHQTVEEAFTSTLLWVRDKMVPAWEEQRVDAEFKALLQRDKINHEMIWSERDKPAIQFGKTPVPAGAAPPFVAPQPSAEAMPAILQPQNIAPPAPEVVAPTEWELDMFDASLLYAGEAPKERHLIENFMVHGTPMALVADGGVGKTYVSLELALRAAAGPCKFEGVPNNFMGFNVMEKMNVIVLTVEDGQHDLHRRICAIDTDGKLRAASKGHCMIVPVQEQLMDGLTLVAKDAKGNFHASPAWKSLLGFIKKAVEKDFRKDFPLLLVIDTYSATHHSDENSATGTNEWFRAAGMLRQYEATLMVTHHVRKPDPKMEIRTPSDMRAAVRGSTAFMNSVRLCYGIWEMPNGDAVVKEMPGLEKGTRIFNMGILKNNTGLGWEERSDHRYPDPMITLRRTGSGRLVYDDLLHQKRIELSANKGEKMAAARAQLKASIIHAVRWYAAEGWPLSERNLCFDKDQFLPPKIREMSRDKEIKPLVQQLVADGTLKQLKIKKTNGMVLDVPEGAYAAGTQTERRSDTPAMQWSHFKYDDEHEEYIKLENVQHVMDV